MFKLMQSCSINQSMLSQSTWYRTSALIRQSFAQEIINNIGHVERSTVNQSDHVHEPDIAQIDFCEFENHYDSICDTNYTLMQQNENFNDFYEYMIGYLVTEKKINQTQIIAVCDVIKLLLKRIGFNTKLSSARTIWNTTSAILTQEYWFMCNHPHVHGPRIGKPQDFADFTCNNVLYPAKLQMGKYYIKLSIREQLRHILPILSDKLMLDLDESNSISDIRNANLAMDMKKVSQDTLTLTLFTDEVPISRSSKMSIFPVYLMINELDRSTRKNYAILVSIYVSSRKPENSTSYFWATIEELRLLETESLTWECFKTKKRYEKKFKLVCVIADAPMRAYLRCVKQYNSKYACDWCKIETYQLNGANKFPVLDIFMIDELVREKEEFLNHAQGHDSHEAVASSIKATSPFLYLKSFDLVWGFSVDILHCVYLGVVKDLFKRGWFNAEKRGQPFFIGESRNLRLLNQRIGNFKVTSEHIRRPRSLIEYKDWKGNEFGSFLIYYFFPVLDKILPFRYIAHLALLAKAMVILQETTLNEDELLEAEYLIHDFQVNLGKLYGDEFHTYNSHILIHLPESARKLGPVGCGSAFISEDYMGKMKKNTRKYSDLPQSLSNIYKMHFYFRFSTPYYNVLDEYEREILFHDHENGSQHQKGRQDYEKTRDLVHFCLRNAFELENVVSHDFIRMKNVIFTTQSYDFDKKRINSVIRVHNEFYLIKKLFSCNQKYFSECQKYIIETNGLNFNHPMSEFPVNMKHLVHYTSLTRYSKFVILNHNVRKLMIYETPNGVNNLLIEPIISFK